MRSNHYYVLQQRFCVKCMANVYAVASTYSGCTGRRATPFILLVTPNVRAYKKNRYAESGSIPSVDRMEFHCLVPIVAKFKIIMAKFKIMPKLHN